MATDFDGLILLGGKSSRMRKDKFAVEWNGKPLLHWQIECLEKITSEVYLSVNPNQLEQLQGKHKFILDGFDAIGPMGGIFSALKKLKRNLIVLAIDMPNVSIQNLETLIMQRQNACFEADGFIQPLPSFWSYDLKDKLEQSIQNKAYSLTHFIKSNDFTILKNQSKEEFINLNRPSDLNLH